MKKLFLLLLATCLLCMPFVPAWAESTPLDLHENRMLAATDGEDAFFFIQTGEDGWAIQSASRAFLSQEPLYALEEGAKPFAMLFADAQYIWYGIYSETLQYEDEGNTWAAGEVFRLARADNATERVLSDVDPQAIFPSDGSSLYYVPWNQGDLLCKIDFITGKDLIVAEITDHLIWMVTESKDALYMILLPGDDDEVLYSVRGQEVRQLPEPSPKPYISWLHGDYRMYQTESDDITYIASLDQPEEVMPLEAPLSGGSIYRYGNVLLSVLESEEGIGNIYYFDLDDPSAIKNVYFDPPPHYFVMGYGGGALVTLDGTGRLLRISDHFETLEQIASLDLAVLYDEGVWLWALPFDDYVVLMGYRYEDSFHHPGVGQPPTLVRVVPTGEGMGIDGEPDAAVG